MNDSKTELFEYSTEDGESPFHKWLISQEVFLMAIKDVANAKGISEIARETKLNRENLYRILSTQGNPKLKSLSSVLHSVGLKLSVEVENQI